jgi:long-chain acyl-CoA synthetase
MTMPERANADLQSSSVAVPIRPIFEYLNDSARNFPNHNAIEFLGRRWRYGDLGRLVDRAARGLQDMGVGKGVKVGLCLPNSPYSVIFYFAILKAGGTVVNFNPLYVERELSNQIKDSETEIMVVLDLPMIYDKVSAVAGEAGLRRIILCPMAEILPATKGMLYRLFKRADQVHPKADDTRVIPYRRVIASATPPAPVSIDPLTDIAVLQYTGGTTGVPKGAMLTHGNLSANCEQIAGQFENSALGTERVLGILPLFHGFAMTCVMNFGVRVAAEMILLPKFEIDQTIDAIEKLRPTIVPGVPTLFAALSAGAEKRKADMSSIRRCMSGGAGLPQDVRLRFERITGCRLFEGYGLSETSPVATANPADAIRDGSAGLPVAGTIIEIRGIDDPNKILPQGERGEICIRGPQVMAGYWKRPEETANVMIDGALRTGDVGFIGPDGYLFIVDRIKDLIICSGFNVYPHVLEEALYEHPAVHEALVIGVPDEYRGQAPKAFVTLNPGTQVTPEELKTHIANYVSKIELPKEIEIRDALPKTAVGKLSRKELVAEEVAKAKAAIAEMKQSV